MKTANYGTEPDEKGIRIVITILSAAGWLTVISAAYILYGIAWEKNVLGTYAFGGTGYELTVSQIGEPDWPFGAAHCRLDFTRGKEVVSSLRVDIDNDGAPAGSGNFRVHWFTDFVRVCVMRRGRLDALCDLYYDGRTEVQKSEIPHKIEEERPSARERTEKILDLELPQDGCAAEKTNTYTGTRASGEAVISLDFHGGNTVAEQIEAKGTWNPLPMPEEFRGLTERMGADWGGDTDEELGEGYWFFLDRHEEASDRYDFYAALERDELHFIAAVYLEQYQFLMLFQYDGQNA